MRPSLINGRNCGYSYAASGDYVGGFIHSPNECTTWIEAAGVLAACHNIIGSGLQIFQCHFPHILPALLTHCGLVTSYAFRDLVNTGSGSGSLPESTQPSNETTLTCDRRDSLTIIKYINRQVLLEIYTFEIIATPHKEQWFEIRSHISYSSKFLTLSANMTVLSQTIKTSEINFFNRWLKYHIWRYFTTRL